MQRGLSPAITILAISALLFACTHTPETSEQTADRETGSTTNIAQLLPGAWKIIAVNCDPAGSSCSTYDASRVFGFSNNGELTVNGRKRGVFRLENGTCVLQTESKEYTVTIVHIDSSRMVTGEPYRNTTEVLHRVR